MERAKAITLLEGTCKHFTSTLNETCKAGLNYRAAAGRGPTPCIPLLGTMPRPECPKRELRTRAEAEQKHAEREAVFAEADRKMRIVLPVVREWRSKPPTGKQAVIECPVCEGRLHLSQSSYNGHVHGRCETDDCVRWME